MGVGKDKTTAACMYTECRFIKSNGLKCQSPPMRGCLFCYFLARLHGVYYGHGGYSHADGELMGNTKSSSRPRREPSCGRKCERRSDMSACVDLCRGECSGDERLRTRLGFHRGFAAYLISRKMNGRVAARVNSRPDTKLIGLCCVGLGCKPRTRLRRVLCFFGRSGVVPRVSRSTPRTKTRPRGPRPGLFSALPTGESSLGPHLRMAGRHGAHSLLEQGIGFLRFRYQSAARRYRQLAGVTATMPQFTLATPCASAPIWKGLKERVCPGCAGPLSVVCICVMGWPAAVY